MAYETGIAQNELDLLDKINKFLTTNPELVRNGQTWTVLTDFRVPATTTQKEIREIAWKSSGTGGEQDIYIAAVTDNLIADDIYNINFYGGTFFDTALVKNNSITLGMINCSPGVVLFADNRPFEYHIVASGRCCKIITRISQVCSSAYLGFILPTVPPTEYPYPLCVAGSAPIVDENKKNIRVRYSNTNDVSSSPVNPQYGNCWLITPDQTWRDFYGESHKNITTDSRYQYLYPLVNYKIYSSYQQADIMTKTGSSPGGGFPLVPIEFVSGNSSSQGINRWGALDGVYWIPGIQRATGDNVMIDDTRKGIVFNGGLKVRNRDFFVVETE